MNKLITLTLLVLGLCTYNSATAATAPNFCAVTTETQKGTPATLGAPSATLFNGIRTIQDMSHRCAKHALNGTAGIMPKQLASQNLPFIPQVKFLARRDAVIFYVPNVAGAADYRAYVVDNTVSFQGTQPRNAVISCAGYRNHHYNLALGNPASPVSGTTPWRELIQAIEVPGFKPTGNYTVVVEAITTPCPFTGSPGHTDAEVSVVQFADESVDLPFCLKITNPCTFSHNSHASIRSFETVRKLYGNVILNGQGSRTSWLDRVTPGIIRGFPVDPASLEIPKDPTVIARSAINIRLPAPDAAINSAIVDVGPNSMFDDFSDDITINPANMKYNYSTGYGDPTRDSFDFTATIPGRWTFWGSRIQQVDRPNSQDTRLLGAQIFQKYGRLYHTFSDVGQDVMSELLFSPLKTLPEQLDQTNQKYVHSFFRVNSDASKRKYWVWLMCGADTREELVDMNTHMPKLLPFMDPGNFNYGNLGFNTGSFTGRNPTTGHHFAGPFANQLSSAIYNKECLLIIQHGSSETGWPSDPNHVRSASHIYITLFSKGVEQGTISLAPQAADPNTTQPLQLTADANNRNGNDNRGWQFSVAPDGTYLGPMVEPFDQFSPLGHYDIFVRPNRLVMFVNGRQGLCVDLNLHPLTMKYGLISYGSLIYHSSADQSESEIYEIADYQYRLNTPLADTKVWDSIGQSEMVDIEKNVFTGFNPGLCTVPFQFTTQGGIFKDTPL